MKNTLNKVQPKNNMFFGPCPCEEECAHIRNQTVKEISRENTFAVANRYLQSREGQHKTRRQAVFNSITGVAFFPMFFQVPVNLGNMGRYRKTKRGCKEWLKNKLGEEAFCKIQELDYRDSDKNTNLRKIVNP